ncbi:hypothetical protein SAMN05421690_10761 [Nitrosomonas sp. Nm51]|uniref:hypothetical protein n=1 Tax=Nitrosomonas sp. Nm51 TaxID=133720 RepID=UPI0008B5CEEE|nr:hypothetical protein [Nitrosomonas sp. Nm51]SER78367.1 hypothetical protein SAMN05421690_10761 [Nitrosomonas sp. Nm51]
MSGLDVVKESIAYLKFWMGALVVSDISLVGWLLNDIESSPDLRIFAAILAVIIVITFQHLFCIDVLTYFPQLDLQKLAQT